MIICAPNCRRAWVPCSLGALTSKRLSRRDDLGDQVVEKSKRVAQIIRQIPGLGYRGDANKLKDKLGGTDVLQAEKRERGYWRGATAMEYDEESDKMLTHVRHRNPKDRGYRVSICHFDTDAMSLSELISVNKQDINARSIEGGELIKQDGEFRWFISYQNASGGDWRIQERRASTVNELETEGTDLVINSSYFHNKDPAFVNGDMYLVSYSRRWMDSKIEKIDVDDSRPTTEKLDLVGTGNARITSGGILGNEVFADTWPDFPLTGVSNILWTTDERSSTGTLDGDSIHLDPSEYFVSGCGGSVTYIDAESVKDSVYLLWQEQKRSGGTDLVGTRIELSDYGEFF